MIPSSTYIERFLKEIDTEFQSPGLPNDRLRLLSKIAIVELCGWLEDALDEIYNDMSGAISDASSRNICSDGIESTSSFGRRVFETKMGLIGIIMFEKILSPAELNTYHVFLRSLNELTESRNPMAHKHIPLIHKEKGPKPFKSPQDLIIILGKIKQGFVLIDKVFASI